MCRAQGVGRALERAASGQVRGTVSVVEHWVDGEYAYTLRRLMRVTERTIEKDGQALLVPEITLEGW